jgi:hypothetical protein
MRRLGRPNSTPTRAAMPPDSAKTMNRFRNGKIVTSL